MSKLPMTATMSSTRPTQSSGIIVAIGAVTGPLRQDAPLDLWATLGWDAYAYEAVYNPARISRADAEAAVREQLAEFGAQVAAFLDEDEPLTASQRGVEWMLRWGCTPDCTADHTDRHTPDWHTSHRVETALRDIDASCSPEENAALPWLAAQVVVINDKARAYGRTTRVWIDYGATTGELSPAEARQALTELRAFTDRLEAVVEAAERSATADFSGDPEIARLDREATDHRVRTITEDAR